MGLFLPAAGRGEGGGQVEVVSNEVGLVDLAKYFHIFLGSSITDACIRVKSNNGTLLLAYEYNDLEGR